MNEFSQYIQIIGRGKKASKSLTQEQAYRAFTLLLGQKITPEQAGAFLMLLRVKEETVEELAGFVQASRQFTDSKITSLGADFDLGCYAGKRRHLPWFILSVLCLAQHGYTFFLHGTQEPTSNRLYLSQAFTELGLPIAKTYTQAQSDIANFGFTYMDLDKCNPALDRLIQMRALFGLRSPANTLARMLNPSSAKHTLHGVFHRNFDQKHCAVAALLKDSNVACLRGEGGEVEVNPERKFTLYIQDKIQQTVIFPELIKYRQIKPPSLLIKELELLWTGQWSFEYGEQAVIGTMACLLTLLNSSYDPQAALTLASRLWQHRTAMPFNCLFK